MILSSHFHISTRFPGSLAMPSSQWTQSAPPLCLGRSCYTAHYHYLQTPFINCNCILWSPIFTYILSRIQCRMMLTAVAACFACWPAPAPASRTESAPAIRHYSPCPGGAAGCACGRTGAACVRTGYPALPSYFGCVRRGAEHRCCQAGPRNFLQHFYQLHIAFDLLLLDSKIGSK